MLNEVFYWLFNMSIIASVMGLLVLLVRLIRIIPRRVAVWLWLIPYVRMCVPFGLNSPYSLLSLISGVTTRTVTVYQPSDLIAFSYTNSVMAANSYFPITYKQSMMDRIFGVAAVIWLIMALMIVLILIVGYGGTMREVNKAALLRDHIRISDSLQAPAVYGIIRPKIVIPSSLADQKLDYVLSHEQTHIRRGDNLWRLIALLITAAHWFNPLAWIFLRCFLMDMELACDEAAIAGYDEAERKEYARALLAFSESRNLFVSAFGGAKLRTRVENILSYRRVTAASAVCFSLLILALIVVTLTNAPGG